MHGNDAYDAIEQKASLTVISANYIDHRRTKERLNGMRRECLEQLQSMKGNFTLLTMRS